MEFVGYLRQVGGILMVLQFPPPMKLTRSFSTNILGMQIVKTDRQKSERSSISVRGAVPKKCICVGKYEKD
jgi:hypothetical protein